MLNFIAVGLSLIAVCFCGFYGRVGLTIINIIVLLLNLPYAIQWLTRG